MSYIVFARKYRPLAFDDIIGQSHVTTTLKNAISQDRVAHAYIFAGPRGVGKTTAARILAKALNCEKGPAPAPCNKCASCLEISNGSSLDVLEIDGASNRGIDEIRNLRESVKFAPAKGRFKVYIIDEVHMLTPEAFNALLKTLEEPPPHVKFIFATTHAHKVPSTILSRCQRFDFRRLATKDIFENLKAIVKKEGLNVKEEAVGLIARHADGSMRDGQVILDQIVSFSKGTVGIDDVTKILGVVDEDVLFGLSGALIAKDAAAALAMLDRLIDEGKDIVQILFGLIEHFRNLAVAKVSSGPHAIVEVSPESMKRYEAEGARLTVEDILYVISVLANTVELTRRSNLPRIPFEAALIKLARSHSIVSLGEILKRLEKIEKTGKSIVDSSQSIVKKEIASSALRPPRNDDAALTAVRNDEPINDNRQPTIDEPAVAIRASPGLMAVVQGWQKVIGAISPKKMSIASYLQEGSLESIDENTLTMSFANEFKFHKEMLESPDNKKMVEDTIKDILGLELKLDFRMAEYPRPAPGTQSRGSVGYREDGIVDPDVETGTDGTAHKDVDPIVSSALQMFGGQIAAQLSKKKKAP